MIQPISMEWPMVAPPITLCCCLLCRYPNSLNFFKTIVWRVFEQCFYYVGSPQGGSVRFILYLVKHAGYNKYIDRR